MATIASVSKKRKRDEEKVLLGEPFIIQPHTSSVFESAIKITPAVVFPRKCVPPSWLSGMPPRLFSASIPALDAPGYVLITKTEGERPLSAVEKISEGVFTLCKLSANVKMGEVRRLAQIVRKPTLPAPEYVHPSKICPEKDWWTQILLDGFDLDAAGAGGGNSVVLSMMHPSVKRKTQEIETQPAQDVRLLSPPAEIVEFREPTPAEILGQVLSQYLEALYVAKTSIAYFTKSTLSRARVKFQQEVTPGVGTSPQGIDQLVEYLQGMLLPLDKMDVKYKKTVIQIATEDTIEDGTMLKNGEEEYVHRWVKVNFNDKIIQHNDPLLKRQIDELKIRETELQIILLLEILALTKDKPTEPVPAEETSKKKKKSKKSTNKKKSKDAPPNTPNPTIILDLLLDRLCIWRSIGSGVVVPESERPKSSHNQKGEEDHLRHFCVEIVMAFYSSRLPETCAAIQKKFGANTPALAGPVPGSATKPSSSSAREKERERQRKRPSLSRSMTLPTKGEKANRNSLPPEFVNVPKPTWKNVDLGAVTKKTLQKREIQMPSLKPQTQTVEDELKDAIKSLSRPNRGAIGAEVMDAATRRLSGAPAPKKKKPVKAGTEGILVAATPKKKDRYKRMQHTQQLSNHNEENEDNDNDHHHHHDDDDDDDINLLPAPKFPLKKKGLQTEIFASPVKTKRSYGGARYASMSALAAKKTLVDSNNRHNGDMVPESSPPPVLGTPFKGGAASMGDIVRRNMFTEKLYDRRRESTREDDDDDNVVPESSPGVPYNNSVPASATISASATASASTISATISTSSATQSQLQHVQSARGKSVGVSSLSLERSKSCLFPTSTRLPPRRDFGNNNNDSPRIAETPQKKKFSGRGGFLQHTDHDHDTDEDDDDGEDGFDANLLSSAVRGGGGSGRGRGSGTGIPPQIQTPIRARRPAGYSQPSLLDFRAISVVGESPIKPKRGGGGPRGGGGGGLDFLRGGMRRDMGVVESSSPPPIPPPSPPPPPPPPPPPSVKEKVAVTGGGGGGGGESASQPVREKSIYESLGWDDDDDDDGF